MTIYWGNGQKLKISAGNSLCAMHITPRRVIADNINLTSLDNYILLDSAGVYLTVKEDN